ncbi:MAG TPA: alpha/beta fold hydrolase, partial [Chthoniobacterales bacterium]|nr:alpha/beta fold hydrolase [Chthoniobacterales bacterium]
MQEKQFYGLGSGGFHRITYHEWGQTSAQPAVICVHGLTRNGRDFDYLARALEGDGRKVFCPDIVGRGKSDWLANPGDYNYAQYLTDMTALIARTGVDSVDWVGTSMGGLIGMLLAAEAKTPIRRLVINDIGPFIPLAAARRVGAYVGQSPVFDDLKGVEKYLREVYAAFGDLSEENWRHLARYGVRAMADNKLSLAYDPAIAQVFLAAEQDVELWSAYDRIRCPVLLLHGLRSDVLSTSVAQEMTRRGPRAELVE